MNTLLTFKYLHVALDILHQKQQNLKVPKERLRSHSCRYLTSPKYEITKSDPEIESSCNLECSLNLEIQSLCADKVKLTRELNNLEEQVCSDFTHELSV